MLFHHYKSLVLTAAVAFCVASCSSLNPVHLGKFTFEGTVKDADGKPVPNAWVKVRGWETLSDVQGKWKQEQVVDCGTLREHVDSYEEHDAIIVEAKGFAPSEEKFMVKHPGWFQSCEAEQRLVFDTVLDSQSADKTRNERAAKPKAPPQESPAIPMPEERPVKQSKASKGKYTL